MGFANFSLKTKVIIFALVLFLPAMALGSVYFLMEVQRYAARTAADGLMNFVDAKQQGVIRFLGQNEKLAKSTFMLATTAGLDAFRTFTTSLVATDVFDVEFHPFNNEIKEGKRHIPTLQVYRSFDFVEDGRIIASSDSAREGNLWLEKHDLSKGYSQVYLDAGKPTLLFAREAGMQAVYIRVDALMLTNITNGEIGNLEGDMGAFYLAGIGKTFDYYIVNKHNQMITESRVYPEAILKQVGSDFPWRATMQTANIACNQQGVYQTNIGAVTGCREAMGYYRGNTEARMLGASMPFYDSEWTIVVEQEADELMQPLYELMVKVGVIGILLAILASVLFVFVINYYVFRPLSNAFDDHT